jgi:hypothetical protein
MPQKIKIPVNEVDYRYQKTVSYSQYATYRHCPHQWSLNYIKKKHDFKPSIHLTFGTAFHETLQYYLKTMYEESGAAADRLEIVPYFKDRLVELYKEALKDMKGEHFSTAEELKEFYEDGVAILEWFKKKRKQYFSTRNTELVGIEIPIIYKTKEGVDNVFFRGHIDFVLYDKTTDTYTIYDIKTSTRGWSEYEKKDQTKLNQIILYKKYLSDLAGIDVEKIDVVFFIVKRKIYESPDYIVPRIQEFKPAAGKVKLKQAHEDFTNFIKEVFTPAGTYIDKEYEKRPGKLCDWCAFNGTEFCEGNKK